MATKFSPVLFPTHLPVYQVPRKYLYKTFGSMVVPDFDDTMKRMCTPDR